MGPGVEESHQLEVVLDGGLDMPEILERIVAPTGAERRLRSRLEEGIHLFVFSFSRLG